MHVFFLLPAYHDTGLPALIQSLFGCLSRATPETKRRCNLCSQAFISLRPKRKHHSTRAELEASELQNDSNPYEAYPELTSRTA